MEAVPAGATTTTTAPPHTAEADHAPQPSHGVVTFESPAVPQVDAGAASPLDSATSRPPLPSPSTVLHGSPALATAQAVGFGDHVQPVGGADAANADVTSPVQS